MRNDGGSGRVNKCVMVDTRGVLADYMLTKGNKKGFILQNKAFSYTCSTLRVT